MNRKQRHNLSCKLYRSKKKVKKLNKEMKAFKKKQVELYKEINNLQTANKEEIYAFQDANKQLTKANK